MKSLVQNEDCSIRPNALVHLSRTLHRNCDYGNCLSNRTGSSSIQQSSSILQHNSTNDQLKSEYLNECSNTIASPDTFCMYQLSQHLLLPSAQSESQLTHDPLLLSTNNQTSLSDLSSEWINQYLNSDNDNDKKQSLMNPSSHKSQQSKSLPLSSASFLPSNEIINRQITSNKSKSTKYEIISNSPMLSSDYLANIDKQFSDANNEIHIDRMHEQDESIGVAKDLLDYMENEWDNLKGDQTSSAKNIELKYENEYKMIQNNPYSNEINQFESGFESYKNGDLLNAILHLESSIHQNPSNSEAWYMLGLCQAENERDPQAIAAFKKSIQIDPKNAEAILALSVSYANESMPNESLKLLDEWLSTHPIYGRDNMDCTSISTTKSYSLDESHFKKVEDRFMKAVQKQSESGDVQLQNALSILYNLNENYQRAVDSLNIALSIAPNNARLWNRLGATLANAGKPAQAICAYKRALSIYPGCVRTRFNISVSCMLLDSYHDAISHLISALEMQQSNELKQQQFTINTNGNDNDNLLSLTLSLPSIWSTLHQAIIKSMTESSSNQSSSDLLTAVRARDLITLKRLLHQIQ